MKRKPDLSVLSINQLAELTGKDRGAVSRALREADLKPARENDHGTYFVPREALPVLYGKEGINPQKERAKLDAARKDMIELQLKERRGSLVSMADVEALGAVVMSGVQLRVMGLRNLVAELRAAASDAEAAEIYEEAARAALQQLSELGEIPGEVRRRKRRGAQGSDGDDEQESSPSA